LRASVQLYEIFKFGIILNVDYAQAIKWQRRSVEISEIINGTVHPETAAAYNNLAVLYEEAGDYKQALEWHRKNVAVTENVYGFMSADTAAAYNNIGSLYMRTEEYDNALSMFLKSAASGDDASIYALAMKNTATVFHLTGRYDQALEMYLGARRFRRRRIHLRLGDEKRRNGVPYNRAIRSGAGNVPWSTRRVYTPVWSRRSKNRAGDERRRRSVHDDRRF